MTINVPKLCGQRKPECGAWPMFFTASCISGAVSAFSIAACTFQVVERNCACVSCSITAGFVTQGFLCPISGATCQKKCRGVQSALLSVSNHSDTHPLPGQTATHCWSLRKGGRQPQCLRVRGCQHRLHKHQQPAAAAPKITIYFGNHSFCMYGGCQGIVVLERTKHFGGEIEILKHRRFEHRNRPNLSMYFWCSMHSTTYYLLVWFAC